MRSLAAAIVLLIVAFLLAVTAIAFAYAQQPRPCIALDLTLYTYDGPIVIDGACVDDIQLTSLHYHIVAHDNIDGIFRNGFEVAP